MIISVDEEIQSLVLYRTSAAINSGILALPRLLKLVLKVGSTACKSQIWASSCSWLKLAKETSDAPDFLPKTLQTYFVPHFHLLQPHVGPSEVRKHILACMCMSKNSRRSKLCWLNRHSFMLKQWMTQKITCSTRYFTIHDQSKWQTKQYRREMPHLSNSSTGQISNLHLVIWSSGHFASLVYTPALIDNIENNFQALYLAKFWAHWW